VRTLELQLASPETSDQAEESRTDVKPDPNFLSLFYVISMGCIMANYEEVTAQSLI
jgi:hypothetical protein